MPIIKCEKCGLAISSFVAACPECGATPPHQDVDSTPAIADAASLLLLLGVLLFIYFCFFYSTGAELEKLVDGSPEDLPRIFDLMQNREIGVTTGLIMAATGAILRRLK